MPRCTIPPRPAPTHDKDIESALADCARAEKGISVVVATDATKPSITTPSAMQSEREQTGFLGMRHET